jgi:hypothetical protein
MPSGWGSAGWPPKGSTMSAFRKALGAAAVCLLAASLAAGQEIPLPPDGFAPGWTKAGPPESFAGAGLFNYIDGGAELFIEFGFDRLTIQDYDNQFLELTLEVYRMDSPEAALGVYLLKIGREAPVKGVPGRNTGDRFQITALRDVWFVHVNNADGLPDAVPAMADLARKLLSALPEGPRVTLLDQLPQKNIVSDSARLFRGPYALQSIYSLGPGDILQQKRTIFGLAADYRTQGGEFYTRIMVHYPDNEAARDAYGYLLKNLDPYLEVVDSSATRFVFRDFQNKYGTVDLKASWLEILVNLPEKPLF